MTADYAAFAMLFFPRRAASWAAGVAAGVLFLACFAAPCGGEPPDPWVEFLAQDRETPAWHKITTHPDEGLTWHELELTSQEWNGMPWRHQLLVAVPDSLTHPRTALLWIAGGSNEQASGAPRRRDRESWHAVLVARAARESGAPAALLRQVPRQPILDGLYEDAAISVTFQDYLDGAPAERLLLFPMVRSVVRAMDALEAFSLAHWETRTDRFVLAGASKRGWTTWLTAAHDERVAAAIPMVIDMLHLEKHLELQKASFGSFSPMISDYTEKGLHEAIHTEAGKRLAELVDPYAYRRHMRMPILILLGTNDPYWPADAVKLYKNDLPSPHVLVHYSPNAGHDLNQGVDAADTLTAFFNAVLHETPLPSLQASLTDTPDGARLVLDHGWAARGGTVWHASSPTRDFRRQTWRPHILKQRHINRPEGIPIPAPESGYRAFYVALDYPLPGGGSYQQCTRIYIMDPDGPID